MVFVLMLVNIVLLVISEIVNKLFFKNIFMLFFFYIGVLSVFILFLYKFEEYGMYFGFI